MSWRSATMVASALMLLASAGLAGPPGLEVTLTPTETRIGDPLELTVTVETGSGPASLTPPDWSDGFGPFARLDGDWQVSREGERTIHRWQGRVAVYEVGEVEFPAIAITLPDGDGPRVLRSDPIPVTVISVLPPDDAESLDIAGLKAPASIPMNLRPLWVGFGLLALLAATALLIWWLIRRYGERFSARPVPDDPFHRQPPHEWAYEQLKALLDSRLAEGGEFDAFFTRLSWILRRYLAGRFRVEIMERTTSEIEPLLRQAGVDQTALEEAMAILGGADLVKFARGGADPERCRSFVERTYQVVDSTRPRPAAGERGAA